MAGNSELFGVMSASSRMQFVASHSQSSLLGLGHRRQPRVFLGEGVEVNPAKEYFIALNLKFILHHNPNLLKVHQAWPHLERSVRIAWQHFRNSSRMPSKFYVPKKTWNPPSENYSYVIEKGLTKGKDLLFKETAALILPKSHRFNPDFKELHDFLRRKSLIRIWAWLSFRSTGTLVMLKTCFKMNMCMNISPWKRFTGFENRHLIE